MAFASSCSQAQPAPESKLALNLSFQEGTAPGSSLNEKFTTWYPWVLPDSNQVEQV